MKSGRGYKLDIPEIEIKKRKKRKKRIRWYIESALGTFGFGFGYFAVLVKCYFCPVFVHANIQ